MCQQGKWEKSWNGMPLCRTRTVSRVLRHHQAAPSPVARSQWMTWVDSSMNERIPTYLHVPFCCCELFSAPNQAGALSLAHHSTRARLYLVPPFRGGVGRVRARAVVAPGGGTVATSSGWCGAPRGTSLRLWLIIPLWGAVGPAISCTVVCAGTIIVAAPVVPSGSAPGGRGLAVGRFRGSLRRLGGRHGAAVLSGFGCT